MEEHKAVINELVNEFADSIENLEDKKELTIAFEKYLYNLVKMAEKIDSSIQAVWLVSEGILDLNFVENPKTEIMSIRLGRRLHSK